MGCGTHFRQTWWPGYDADAIDPNKAFDYQRRVALAKKIALGLLVLVVVAVLAYLLVCFLRGGFSSNCAQNGTQTTGKIRTNQSENLPSTHALNQASVLATRFDHESNFEEEDDVQVKSDEDEIILGILGSDNSTVVHGDVSSILNGSDVALVSFQTGNTSNDSIAQNTLKSPGANFNESDTHKENHSQTKHSEEKNTPNGEFGNIDSSNSNSSHSNKPTATHETPKLSNASESDLWCSSKENMVECVALSRNFKTVTTFLNPRKHNGSVEGYVMVKMKDSKWSPFCHPEDWTLEMGYKLCQGLGFQQLVRLSSINISDLKQRITTLGKQVSLQFNPDNQAHPLEVLMQPSGAPSLPNGRAYFSKSNSGKINCQVGFLTCD